MLEALAYLLLCSLFNSIIAGWAPMEFDAGEICENIKTITVYFNGTCLRKI
jgi:hypothetical protein